MKKWTFILALSLSFATWSCDEHGHTGVAIKNDLWIGTDDKNANSITKEEFDKAIDDVEAIYRSIVADKGATLKVMRKWGRWDSECFCQARG